MSSIPPSSMPQIGLPDQLASFPEPDVGMEAKAGYATMPCNQSVVSVREKKYAELGVQAGLSMVHHIRIPERKRPPSTPKQGTFVMGVSCSPTNIAGTAGRKERAAKARSAVAIAIAKRDEEIAVMKSLRKSPPSYLKYLPRMWTPPKAMITTPLPTTHGLIAFEQHHTEDAAQLDKHYKQLLQLEKGMSGEVVIKGDTPEKKRETMTILVGDQTAAPIAALAPARPSIALVLRRPRPLIRSVSTSAAGGPTASTKGTIQGTGRLVHPKSVVRSFSAPVSGSTTTTTRIAQPTLSHNASGPKGKTPPTPCVFRPHPATIPKAATSPRTGGSIALSKIGRIGVGIKAITPTSLIGNRVRPASIPKAAMPIQTGGLKAPTKTSLAFSGTGTVPRRSLARPATTTVSKTTTPGARLTTATLKKPVSAQATKPSIAPHVRPVKTLPTTTATQASASSARRKPLAPVSSNTVPPVRTAKKAAGPSKATLPARGTTAPTKLLAPVRHAGVPAPARRQVTARSTAAPPQSTTALAAKKRPPGVARPVRSAPPAPKPVIKVTRPTPQIVTRIVSAPSTGPSEEEDEGLTVPGASRRVRTLKRISKAVEYELEDDCEEVEKEVEEPEHGASSPPSTDPVTASESVSIPEAAPVHHRQPVHPAISDDQLMAQVYRHTKRLKAKYAEDNPGSGRSGYLKYLHEVKTKWKNARQAEIEELKGVVSRYGSLLANTALASGFGNGEPMRAYWLARKMEALVALSGVSLKTRQEAHPSTDYAAGIFCTMAKRDIKKKFEVVLWMQFVAEHPNATMEDFQSFLFVCSL